MSQKIKKYVDGEAGHAFACRQTLVGGAYALLDLHARQAHPDFYATLLWHRLAGGAVLALHRLGEAHPTARFYARCAARTRGDDEAADDDEAAGDGDAAGDGRRGRGGVLLVGLNPGGAEVAVAVAVAGVEGGGGAPPRRLEFVLTPHADAVDGDGPLAAARARRVLLNGEGPLHVGGDGALPRLRPRRAAGLLVRLPPRAVGFFVWPELHPECGDG